MREGRASATAYRVAERRAVHQLLDRPPVFVDPLALRILSRERAAADSDAPKGKSFSRQPLPERSRREPQAWS
jgi:O-methyltransferase involved in polyketide biosynthesis